MPECGTEQPIEQPRAWRSGNVMALRKPRKPAADEDFEAGTKAEGDAAVLDHSSDLGDEEDEVLGTDLDGDGPDR